ncbi:ATP-dependent DNA helicase [Mycena indigotica]|uniref:ATP-dependent DNA helicase n=1 Tax=Mycena indigotica TaxID=2126181 RepID=A0A8H6W855_9AGAR|nr:ATP-dependent DNA helicase [Mycena indigotica]KAF7309344.1 ATP-dependent DNA helicase [Mycena indigotica]
MWVGDVPFDLAVLTLPERLLIGIYFPAAYVVKLFPKKHGGDSWDQDGMNKGMRGNVSTYRLPPDAVADMVEGNLMPRPVALLPSVLSVTFVGARNVPLFILPDIFEVNRVRVHRALLWLKHNNKLYFDIEISQERLEQLPQHGIPDELTTTARYSEDELLPFREHAGYVPSDDTEDTEINEAEERDFERHKGKYLLPTNPLTNEENDDAEHYGPAVIPLQPHGAVDVAGDSLDDQRLFEAAARNLVPEPQRKYAVKHGSEFVNEYPRKEKGKRTDGGASNPNHLLGAFPCLFPYGFGGLEVDREQAVSYESHIRWALQYEDGRFRKDFYFMFQAMGVLVKRQMCRSACLQLDFNTYAQNQAAFQRLTAKDFLKASEEEKRKQPISNVTIKAFRKQITAPYALKCGA